MTPEQVWDYSPDGGEGLLAIILRNQYRPEGVHFVTDPNSEQQVAVISHPTGKEIPAHYHPENPRRIVRTQEVIIVRSGILRVELYTSHGTHFASKILADGDVIILLAGGHGFKAVTPVELLEVKQGPYL